MTTTIGPAIRDARQRRGWTQERLAQHLSPPTTKWVIHDLEKEVRSPSADEVKAISRALDDPNLLVVHCQACPVCTELLPVRFPSLDNVPTHPTTVSHKAAEEAREAAEALEELFQIFLRNDWHQSAEVKERVIELLVQVRDIEVGIRILYESLFLHGLLPMEVLTEVNRRQYQKCVDKGYCTPRTGTEG